MRLGRVISARAMATAASRQGGDARVRAFLSKHGISTERWGTGTAKSAASLAREVDAGETTLVEHGGLPRRRLRVARLLVRDVSGTRVLVEAKQVLPDGRERRRQCLPSEKLLEGESAAAAALRCVREELGSALPDGGDGVARVVEGSASTRHVEADSQSYPGLVTLYEFITLQVEVDGLQQGGGFETTEPTPDGVLTSFWEWREELPPEPS